MKYFSQACETGSSPLRLNPLRLRRLMCGKALPFRNAVYFFLEAMPHKVRARHSLASSNYQLAERQSLSAHQAAKPRSGFVLVLEATEGV
jgi:hypothetical protein